MAGFSSTDMQELKDIVRIGQVSKVNAGEMTARVQIPDQGIVTGDLRIVKRPPTVECETGCKIKVKPWIPTVGQRQRRGKQQNTLRCVHRKPTQN